MPMNAVNEAKVRGVVQVICASTIGLAVAVNVSTVEQNLKNNGFPEDLSYMLSKTVAYITPILAHQMPGEQLANLTVKYINSQM